MSKSETPAEMSLTQAELDAMQVRVSAELTDAELESISGGKGSNVNVNRRPGRWPWRR
jgi:bacteriocin-like protein